MEILNMDVVKRKLYSHLRLVGIDNRHRGPDSNTLLNCITYLPENDANYLYFSLINRHYENLQKHLKKYLISGARITYLYEIEI